MRSLKNSLKSDSNHTDHSADSSDSSTEKRLSVESYEDYKQHQHPSIPVPVSFKIYCDKSRFKYASFYIGRKKGDQLNAISVNYTMGIYSKIALHCGPSMDSSAWARAEINESSINVSLIGTETADVRVDHGIFNFPIATGVTERFEWQKSHGPEVKNLRGHGGGWKLVRMMEDPQETVAAYKVDLNKPKLSGRFEFLGSGATKELGRDWAVMAIITALSLGQRKRDETNFLVAVV